MTGVERFLFELLAGFGTAAVIVTANAAVDLIRGLR